MKGLEGGEELEWNILDQMGLLKGGYLDKYKILKKEIFLKNRK